MHVPEGWNEEKLGDLFDFKNGANTKAANYGSGIKFVNVMDIFENNVLTCKKIKESVNLPAKKADLYRLKMGDILFNRTSETFNEIALTSVYLDSRLAIFGGFVIRGRPISDSLNLQFCIYCFSSSSVRKELIRRGQGAIRANIGQADLRHVPLLVPPLLEQQKIAKILSTWDKAIEKLEALILAKKTRKKALMQQLLTEKKRFDDEWDEFKLKEILTEKKSRNKKGLVERVLSVTNHSGFVLPENLFSRRAASNDLSNYKIVEKGQFGYNPSRINVGSFARLDEYKIGVLSPMYVIFSINDKKLDSNFFINWMSSHEAKQKISSSTQGSVRNSVGFNTLGMFIIKLPSLSEQQKVASVLSAADQEIENNQQQLETLKQQKKGLMQQLLTGKKRVKLKE